MIEFDGSLEGEQVLLKVSPIKGVICFDNQGKISPRYIGSFEVLKYVGDVAYELALPRGLLRVHPFFQVSMMKKYMVMGTIIFVMVQILLNENLSYYDEPVAILDREICQLRSKEIASMKFQWKYRLIEESTSKTENHMHRRYPHHFTN
ncbi:uncharacterized protein LOC125836843 [Solanum verrucosum]|uniref:uncharacterized protein LOC125836843 n=1 Tax=Solanum verrucosum TaxID=315347 RepID=UPI0020D10AEE|nr:uncharacterized protein LOC125836843 [Solanum verrucosum]